MDEFSCRSWRPCIRRFHLRKATRRHRFINDRSHSCRGAGTGEQVEAQIRSIGAAATLLRSPAIITGFVLSLWATQALADSCKAIPDRGPMPAYLAPGKAFSGPVAYVGDGDSLCVAVGPTPDKWVEVRVADFYAPELNAPGGRQARAALSRIVAGRTAVCVAGRRTYDRVVAVCRIDGRSVGDLMRAAGVVEGGNGRR